MKLIDADALPKYTGYALSADEVATAVENAPTIDAFPVVRCKDCKHSKEKISDRMQCEYFNAWFPFDFYCAWGERKDLNV